MQHVEKQAGISLLCQLELKYLLLYFAASLKQLCSQVT